MRRVAVSAAENQPHLWNSVRPLLKDSVRSVRNEAAWVLRRELDPQSSNAQELHEWMDHISDQPSGTLRKASYYESRGESAEAEKQYRRLIEMDPYSWTGYHELTRFLSTIQKSGESLSLLEKGISLVTEPIQLEYDLALIQAEQGNFKAAEKSFLKVMKRNRSFPRAAYNLGLLQNQLGKTKESIQTLRTAIAIDPTSPDASYALATILIQQKQLPEAKGLLEKIVFKYPQHSAAQQLLRQISNQ